MEKPKTYREKKREGRKGAEVPDHLLGEGVARRGDVGEGVAVRPAAAWWASRRWQCSFLIR
jgi:hypothetical protein